MFRIPVLLLTVLIPGAASPPEVVRRQVTLWAWERSEDLRFLPPDVGVAYLAATLTLHQGVAIRPRAQPLRVPPSTRPRPVVRIEQREGTSLCTLSQSDREALVQALVAAARGGDWLQIDFDARRSEEQAYVELLAKVREAAPGLQLSITGLASWCVSGSFIERAPVSSVVPQLFRMGAESEVWRARASSFPERCSSSVGLSVDEALTPPANARSVFLFNPKPWTKEAFAAAMTKVQ